MATTCTDQCASSRTFVCDDGVVLGDAFLSVFEQFVWRDGRMLLDDLVFRIDDHQDTGSDDHFDLYKTRALLDRYARFLDTSGFRPRNVLELGTWDGGSAALWFEVFQPAKLVSVDVDARGDSEYFTRYVQSRNLEHRLRTYWETDQADGDRLREIVAREFDGPLDLVVDDASHLYAPTKSSFETLFPYLRRGGLYIIEDWHWEHGEAFQDPTHPWADEESLTKLVVQLVEAAGTQKKGTIAALTIFGGFLVVERGWMTLEDPLDFRLEDRIWRRPWRVPGAGRPHGPPPEG